MKNENEIYTLELDEKYIYSLNKAMNIKRVEIDNIEKSNELYAAVNNTISAMHKIISMKFHTKEHISDAYDFRELLSIGGVLISSINTLFVVLFPDDVVKNNISKQSNIIKVYNSSECFNKNDYTDKEYYDYMRSLCSIHPTNTDRSSRGKDKIGNNVLFNINWGLSETNGIKDIYIVVGRGNEVSDIRDPNSKLCIVNFEKFIIRIIELLDIIINEIMNLKIKPKEIKSITDFNGDYDHYLFNLQNECIDRKMIRSLYNSNAITYINMQPYDIFRTLLQTVVTNDINKTRVDMYKNAIKYAFNFEHNRLVNYRNQGVDATGIENKFEVKGNFTLLQLLEFKLSNLYFLNANILLFSIDCIEPPFQLEEFDLRYNLLDKNVSSSEQTIIKNTLLKYSGMLNKYINITGNENDYEFVLLINTAIYMYEVSKRCSILSANIPHDKKFIDYDLENEINGFNVI